MIGKNFVMENKESFSKHNEKPFAGKFLTVAGKSSQNRNDFAFKYDVNDHIYSKPKSI